jgi:hypothetical protein
MVAVVRPATAFHAIARLGGDRQLLNPTLSTRFAAAFL